MLHNKYFWILERFLPDLGGEVYGRKLEGEIPISQKAIAIALDELEGKGILKSRKQGNIKYFSLNNKNPEAKDVILSAETMRKINFLNSHRKLAEIFKADDRVVGIFGSYSKGKETKSSDVDVFIIGPKVSRDYDKSGGLLDLDISIKYFLEKDFRKLARDKNNLIKEIIGNHILIFGAEKFIKIIWRDYYGFD